MRETALRLAVEEENRRKTNANDTHERSIIIIGSKGVVSDKVKGSTRLSYFVSAAAFLGQDDDGVSIS